MEELVESKIVELGKLRKIYSDVQYLRSYLGVLRKSGTPSGLSPPDGMPKQLFSLVINGAPPRLGPLPIEGNNPYLVKDLGCMVSTDRKDKPLGAVIDLSQGVKVYLVFERPQTVVGIDIGLRHLITAVAVTNGRPVKTRMWGDEKLNMEFMRFLGEPQGLARVGGLRQRVEKMLEDVVVYIASWNPKTVALENLRETTGRMGTSLRIVQETLERVMYNHGVKYKRMSPLNTSRICSNCGYRKGELTGSLFQCPVCGYVADRDFNAALNLALKCYYTC
ncbi:transposase [Sulfodiicoccus acidiphilus]|uniref:Transposase n=1 Tax=Sulfodiicoccus acidiphilus TaxID=1670455 RepID=A0A348B6Q0_9CREN|nr:zinc ribbon domain-containing protein [Sulfodiicoccus acidiphilus]BBD73852.1 transposase [Sulfodiicoccus acidiphilus]GGT96318.1 transposase [Sulfodiicoccus acidiphilus]